MSLTIQTFVSIDSRPLTSIKPAGITKKGTPFPDSVSLTVHDISEFTDESGNVTDRETKYEFRVLAANAAEAAELNRLLRVYDYKKFPLQIETNILRAGGVWDQAGQKFVSAFGEFQADAVSTAADIIKKLKSPSK